MPFFLQEKRKAVSRQTIVILDFGSQYSQLIARRIRELDVYCELLPHDVSAVRLKALRPIGIILSGGPASVYEVEAPKLPVFLMELGIPILGICYGMQLLVHALGGQVEPSDKREYGLATIEIIETKNPLLATVSQAKTDVWMSHGDRVAALPKGFQPIANSDNSPFAAMVDETQTIFGIQFHPEVVHTVEGREILRAFVYDICQAEGGWTTGNIIEETIAMIKAQVGAGQVVCGLSGGVDSSVVAALLHEAIGDQLTCIFVNTGMLRLNEPEQVVETFRTQMQTKLIAVDATETFLTALADVAYPEQKRKIIGEKFIRIFEAEAQKLGHIDFLAQGTLYPDVIESAGTGKSAAKIKTHHNVGGLPDDMAFELVEPLRMMFKDEVRAVGEALGLPKEIVWRHPFPGPGLAVRILGDVTWDRLETLRQADAIFMEELWAADWYHRTSQAFVVLLPVRSVGVMGDYRTYGQVAALRAVTTDDFMTADWAHLPTDLLGRVSNRIVNEVSEITRVVYDISSKPPATIEWE
ncbi:MAG: glutamine-hydrolyzing GMP synthase [Chloroflexota bacterium]